MKNGKILPSPKARSPVSRVDHKAFDWFDKVMLTLVGSAILLIIVGIIFADISFVGYAMIAVLIGFGPIMVQLALLFRSFFIE